MSNGTIGQIAPDFTGTGYVDFEKSSESPTSIEWTFDAPTSGVYTLEFRYSLEEGQYPIAVKVNDQPKGEVVFWTTSSDETWAWDRIPIRLSKGGNRIRLEGTEGLSRIDHLNVRFEKSARQER